jgi:hypothetical protein
MAIHAAVVGSVSGKTFLLVAGSRFLFPSGRGFTHVGAAEIFDGCYDSTVISTPVTTPRHGRIAEGTTRSLAGGISALSWVGRSA